MSEVQEGPPSQIANRLGAGEALVWWGRPVPSFAALRELNGDFAVAVGGVSVVVGVVVHLIINFPVSIAASILAAVPLLFAFWMGVLMVSRPIRAFRRAETTLFALTSKRALVFDGTEARTFPFDKIDFVETKLVVDGIGHVLFYTDASPLGQMELNRRWRPQVRRYGFIAIPDAAFVGNRMMLLARMHRPSVVGEAATT